MAGAQPRNGYLITVQGIYRWTSAVSEVLELGALVQLSEHSGVLVPLLASCQSYMTSPGPVLTWGQARRKP